MYGITICLWNWDDYNNDVENFEWFTLPKDEEKMKEWIKDLSDKGKEEIFICDSNHDFIDKDTNIEALIALSKEDKNKIIDMSSYKPIYDLVNLDAMLDGYTPTEIAIMIGYGFYIRSDRYFTFNEQGHVVTMNEKKARKYREQAFNEGAEEFLCNFKGGI